MAVVPARRPCPGGGGRWGKLRGELRVLPVFSVETILTRTIDPTVVAIVPSSVTLTHTGPTVKTFMQRLRAISRSALAARGQSPHLAFLHSKTDGFQGSFAPGTGSLRCGRLFVHSLLAAFAIVGSAGGDEFAPAFPQDPVGAIDGEIAGATPVPQMQLGEIAEPGGLVAVEPIREGLPSLPDRLADDMRLDEPMLEQMPDELSSGNWFSLGQYYGSIENVWMGRNREYRRVVGRDVLIPVPLGRNKQGVFSTDSIPYDLAPGARVTLGTFLGRDYLNRDQSLELTYYGGFSFAINDTWNAIILNSGTASSFLVPTIAAASPGFTGAQEYDLKTTSNFNSLELNWKLHRRLGRDKVTMSPNGDWTKHAERGWLPSLIVGPRIANVNETCTFSGRMPGQPVSTFGGDYAIETQNWLLGLNLGGELISQNEFFYWGLRGRVAPAISFTANQQSFYGVNNYLPSSIPIRGLDGNQIVFDGVPQTVTVPQGTESWQMAATQTAPGFLGDLSILAGWNVTPNFAVQCSYDFLWIGGLATATRQFNMNKIRQNPIDGGGQMFLNGFAFGINGTW